MLDKRGLGQGIWKSDCVVIYAFCLSREENHIAVKKVIFWLCFTSENMLCELLSLINRAEHLLNNFFWLSDSRYSVRVMSKCDFSSKRR